MSSISSFETITWQLEENFILLFIDLTGKNQYKNIFLCSAINIFYNCILCKQK